MTEFSTKKYNGFELITRDVNVLEQIEKIVGKPISEVDVINRETTGFISKDKRCIAIPTTAAGASMTPYATIWGREKISISTRKPVLKMVPHQQLRLL